MQPEDNAYLPQRSHRRSGKPGRNLIDKLITIGQQLAQPGGYGADNQKRERYDDGQANRRREEILH